MQAKHTYTNLHAGYDANKQYKLYTRFHTLTDGCLGPTSYWHIRAKDTTFGPKHGHQRRLTSPYINLNAVPLLGCSSFCLPILVPEV